MFRLTSDIKISSYSFAAIVDVKVKSSWDLHTDTCQIVIPRKVNWRGRAIAFGDNPLIKRGDSVDVSLGYGDINKKVFSGYLHQIKASIPTMINCQDDMWLLKQNTITASFENTTLKDMLFHVLPSSVPFEAPDITLGQLRITNATPAQILEALRKDFFLKSWFRNGTLYVGFAYVPSLQSEYVVRMNKNVVENNLEYFRQEDIKIRLKMISIQSDNSKIEYETGDATGEQRTLYYYQKTLADLKALADEEIQRLRYEGYRGSIKIFGQPTFNHGDIVDLRDETYPDRDGRYLVKSVEIEFGQSGFRQTLELDAKI
jgi:hypothetical protein